MNAIHPVSFVLLSLNVTVVMVYAELVPKNATVFIVPMEGDMDKFLAAEIIKQKLPIRVSLSEEKADYIIVGNSIKKDGSNKWYHYFSGTAGLKDSVQASISLVEKKTESVVWAGNAGDRSIWWGALARGGERKASLRLVKALKKALKKR